MRTPEHSAAASRVEEETLPVSGPVTRIDLPDEMPALTVLYHRDASRVGQVARLCGLLSGRTASLSRLEPVFAHPGSLSGRALDDRFVSRSPVTLTRAGDGVTLEASAQNLAVTVNGVPLRDRVHVPWGDLGEGVVIELGARGVVLLLHRVPSLPPERPPRLGLVGDSPGVERLRGEITRIAGLATSALIQGETGTGKELVARALHDASPRRARPFVAVNMAAIPEGLAASTLFGHVASAFTDAKKDRRGYFARADGGTLFLDEIGEMPRAVQASLLRALEEGQIEPVGADRAQRVDVRVLAATDAKLDRAIEEGRFSEALLHRLAGYQVELPPLRARRDDIARLLVHFLEQELDAFGRASALTPAETEARPWLPPALVARLVRYDWPGNVRELRNAARQIAVASHEASEATPPPVLERRFASASNRPSPVELVQQSAVHEAPRRRRRVTDITDEELVEALRRNGWRRDPTADQLGISRSSLYGLMDRCARIPKASAIPVEQLRRAWAECEGDLERMSARLEVSVQALKVRLNGLDLV